jgi:hypothetical protein
VLKPIEDFGKQWRFSNYLDKGQSRRFREFLTGLENSRLPSLYDSMLRKNRLYCKDQSGFNFDAALERVHLSEDAKQSIQNKLT